eukprot:TRINITY_DN465_c3_g1_i1.p1 TRINITY_DN465_c3_g1~~TRINITY_DN465_c3_g1_i1.p1  ORF type:complete len:429 (-),score=66.08 TRINITY_DN465_c3_g1_i1:16-1302(-)
MTKQQSRAQRLNTSFSKLTSNAKRSSYMLMDSSLRFLSFMLVILNDIYRGEKPQVIIEKLYEHHQNNSKWGRDKLSEQLRSIPTRYLSFLWGRIASWRAPLPIQLSLNFLYACFCGCNLREAEKRLREYKSLSELFTRNLKPGVRRVDEDALLVSPVDGKIVNYGKLPLDEEEPVLEQIKGINYKLSDFVGEDSALFDVIKRIKNQPENTPNKSHLYFCTIYLAPGDYHKYHSPVSWKITERCHFPGHLLPVAAWATHLIKGLFALNERVVLSGEWKHGFFSYSPVGAYNVGSIKLDFDQELITNRVDQRSDSSPEFKRYKDAIQLEKGITIGHFNMGSSIVLIFEAPELLFTVPRGERIKLGEPLAFSLENELALLRCENVILSKCVQSRFWRKRKYEELIETTRKYKIRSQKFISSTPNNVNNCKY